MPLAMKRQINDQKKQSFPNTNLDRLGKTGTTSQLHFSAMHKLYPGSPRPNKEWSLG